MKKYLIPSLIFLAFLLWNCPDAGVSPTSPPEPTGTPGLNNPKPTPGITAIPIPTPNVILIDNFNTYPTNTPLPVTSWSSGCVTSYTSPPRTLNRGVTVINYSAIQKNVLNLMYDIFAKASEKGAGSFGYAYAQKIFNAPKAGVLSFSYYHIGFNLPEDAPSYALDFWTEFTDDIENKNTNILFSNTTATDIDPFKVCTVNIPAAGDYYLTWRVKKTTAPDQEDEIYIDDIKFTY